jgi:hypothetical protein
LLDDQLEIPNVSVEMKKLLSNFKRSRPAISPTFPESDIMAGLLRWRESTTTSPSGKHLGIYREQYKITYNVHKTTINPKISPTYYS